MLKINKRVAIPMDEIELNAIRARGAGGQNVNKVSTAIHLHFEIQSSSLPALYKQRLLKLKDRRISKDGIVIIKAQQYRSQEKNRQVALTRLLDLIRSVAITRKKRIATKPTINSRLKRIDNKVKRGQLKLLRRKNLIDE